MTQEYPLAKRPDFIEATPDGSAALNWAWPLVRPSIAPFAYKVSNCQADINDMLGEAMATLWKLGPERFQLTAETDLGYVSRTLVHRMSKLWAGGNQKKQAEAEQAVRAMVGPVVVSEYERDPIAMHSRDLLDDALLNEEEFDEIIAQREDGDDLLTGADDSEAA
jgi:hypothetical protein